jgi:hypothetical protein
MNISEAEYLERLIYLMPCKSVVVTQGISLDNESVHHCATMVEDIAEIVIGKLSAFKETDQVLELKDAALNIAVLGRFLGIVLFEMFNQPQDPNEKKL